MPSDIPEALRRLVIERASRRCEYCLLPQSVVLHRHEPDHIVPRQHGGATEERNLALACMRRNRHKGPNVGSFDPVTGKLVPLFNPRIHNWPDHFELDGAMIRPLTAQARVTVRLLCLNDEERVAERERLAAAGRYGYAPEAS